MLVDEQVLLSTASEGTDGAAEPPALIATQPGDVLVSWDTWEVRSWQAGEAGMRVSTTLSLRIWFAFSRDLNR